MAYKREELAPEKIEAQMELCARIEAMNKAGGKQLLAMVDTYGCQQNEADSERLRGYLQKMGYGFTQDETQADLVVINTCAIREHAEMRVLGNVGNLTHTKAKNPDQIIAVCGCMVQQEHMAEKLKKAIMEKGYIFYLDSPTNQQFVLLDNKKKKELLEQVDFDFFENYDSEHTVMRFVTSWATREEDVDRLIEIL